MSPQIEREIAVLRKRKVPETDPRIQGLLRRQVAEKEAEKKASGVSHTERVK